MFTIYVTNKLFTWEKRVGHDKSEVGQQESGIVEDDVEISAFGVSLHCTCDTTNQCVGKSESNNLIRLI